VSGFSTNGLDYTLNIIDLGNTFNRVPSIAPNDQAEYTSATRDEVLKYGFILDNLSLTPDNTSETDLGTNLIG